MALKSYFDKDHSLQPDSSTFESGWLFHSQSWRNAICDGFGIQSCDLVTELDGKVAAITPIYVRRRFGISLCGSPLRGTFTQYMGPRFARDLSVVDRCAVVADQASTLCSKEYSYIELGAASDSTPDGGAVYSQLGRFQFHYHPQPSLVVDLSKGLDAAWSAFEGRARNMIRKSEKKQVAAQIEPLDSALLSEYFNMLAATFRHQGLAIPHSFTAYAAMVRHLYSINCMMFVSARSEGQLISAGIFLYRGDRMLFHSGSSTPEGLALAGSSLVQWKAIQEGFVRGVLNYDLGGVGIDSIDQFKKSFGGASVQHHRWVFSSPFVRRSKRIAGWLAQKGLLRVFG